MIKRILFFCMAYFISTIGLMHFLHFSAEQALILVGTIVLLSIAVDI